MYVGSRYHSAVPRYSYIRIGILILLSEARYLSVRDKEKNS